ncbi:MAG: L-2-hydroxyglutarate oxidase [Phaeodactylibacter sp.]|uniref:L-2-hydroxyglutarate oxidase n=1 Tax=Phaeodactylibacter sp. TaxID=1940289 RepID=UPI0032EDF98D
MDVGVIGGGILGLAIAQLISKQGHNVTVFEKDQVGSHQSGNNSGVLHCGLHYKPGSLKAKLAVDGIHKMVSFCEEHNINHDISGKVVVATTYDEIRRLRDLATRGEKNGLNGLTFLTKQELRKREPHVRAEEALLVPEEGIVDYKSVLQAFEKIIKNNAGEVLENSKVIRIDQLNTKKSVIHTPELGQEFDFIINCTGLYSDKNYKLFTKKKPDLKIIPFRGEYLKLKKEFNHLVNHLIYPVPDPQFPFLGVHFTRLLNGGREVGPNAVLALSREGYTWKDFDLREAIESLSYIGLLRFLKNHFAFSIEELKSSMTIDGFVKKAKKLIPDVEANMFEERTAGVRAQAMSVSGELLMDFEIKRFHNQIHVLNAPSPGATASLAIAEHIIKNHLDL